MQCIIMEKPSTFRFPSTQWPCRKTMYFRHFLSISLWIYFAVYDVRLTFAAYDIMLTFVVYDIMLTFATCDIMTPTQGLLEALSLPLTKIHIRCELLHRGSVCFGECFIFYHYSIYWSDTSLGILITSYKSL